MKKNKKPKRNQDKLKDSVISTAIRIATATLRNIVTTVKGEDPVESSIYEAEDVVHELLKHRKEKRKTGKKARK